MFLCALFNTPEAQVDDITTIYSAKLVRTPEYLVPLAVGYVQHMPIVTQVAFPMKQPTFPMPRAWPRVFNWREVVNYCYENVNDPSVTNMPLNAIATTHRMKIRGRHCSIAQVLRANALCRWRFWRHVFKTRVAC
jgi:hypothetical protein